MNKIVINGKEIRCNGNNISVRNNKVFVDGKLISEEAEKIAIYMFMETFKI